MKQIYILPAMMLIVTITKGQTALQLNDDLAAITGSLYSKGQKWGLVFNDAYKDGN